ncbi:hypothetical protein [Mesorhizobium sp. CAU 1732]|uniref:hypothetical protein n=1 Tax=Mesorhizobium sp. CAU 1732 TaxID=3140358 RepID=UPI00326102A3
MQLISIPWVLDVIDTVNKIRSETLPSEKMMAHFMLFKAKDRVSSLYNDSIYKSYLRSSRESGEALKAAIDRVLQQPLTNDITDFAKFEIGVAVDNFVKIFRSELATIPIFLVTQKGSFDPVLLVSDGVGLFPPEMITKAPETLADAREVGRALAYEMGTACGFHTFRIMESVLKRYWDAASMGKPRPKPQTIGVFASHMDSQNIGDERIYESLKQIGRLHRNPIIHPEVVLTVEEAFGTVGIARSVIGAMLAYLPDAAPTTTNPLLLDTSNLPPPTLTTVPDVK